jgi:hypothetical protein
VRGAVGVRHKHNIAVCPDVVRSRQAPAEAASPAAGRFRYQA